jgi:hypothetical protein
VNTKYQDQFAVAGARDDWYRRCIAAMETAGFKKINANNALYQVSGRYRRWPKPVGRLEISVLPIGEDQTQFVITSVCRTDISAATGNPNVLLLEIFKDALGEQAAT